MGTIQNDFRLEDHKRGTTWYGMSLMLSKTLDNGSKVPVDLTGAIVTAEFSKNPGNSASFSYSTQNQTLFFGPENAPDPSTGEILFEPELINYPAYAYILRVYVQFPSNDKDLILEGYWNITD
jgi:hypothetical protein